MPTTVFGAIRENIGAFLGGAQVHLIPQERSIVVQDDDSMVIREVITIEDVIYHFEARRVALAFTQFEKIFCRELLTAFAAMFAGFRQEGYAAHFRTALLASIMDITVARSLRGDHRKGFWPIQQLIQLLKSLSYQRYEGTPATTGFIIYRTSLPDFRKLVSSKKHTLIPLHPSQQISPGFFDNPLTYRFIDGKNLFFTANISMQVTGLLRTRNAETSNDIEKLSNREILSLVRSSGAGAFAVTVNEASEVEVLINPEKILVRRKGLWAIFDPDIIRSFLGGCIDPAGADELLWTVYALSKSRHGTVILLYQQPESQLPRLKKGSVGGDDPIGRLLISRIKGRSIGDLKRAGTLLRILSSDGITVLGPNGKLLDTGFIIDTSHAHEVVSGGGRSTAASAASIFGKVIKVSQDGPIELYSNGRRVYSFG